MTPLKMIAVGTAGVAVLAALAGCDWASTSSETHSYQVQSTVSRLDLRTVAGRIEITTGDGPIQVTEVYRYTRNAPKTSHSTAEGTLKLTDNSCGNQHVGRCEIDYSVRVPAATAVEITIDAGSVDVTGLAGDLTVSSHAGEIQAANLTSAHTRAHTDAGQVALAYRQPPLSIDARTSAGQVLVLVPVGDSYAVDADTDAGKVTVGVLQDSRSTRTISAHSDAGTVRVSTTRPVPGAGPPMPVPDGTITDSVAP